MAPRRMTSGGGGEEDGRYIPGNVLRLCPGGSSVSASEATNRVQLGSPHLQLRGTPSTHVDDEG